MSMTEGELLLHRIDNVMNGKNVKWSIKTMFGGTCYMVDDKMCFGTYKGGLMARVDPEELEELATRHGAEQMIHGGRSMKGYMWIAPEGCDSEEELEFWIQRCLDFNPKAKASKRKKK